MLINSVAREDGRRVGEPHLDELPLIDKRRCRRSDWP